MTDFIPGDYLTAAQVLEKDSIVEAFSNESVRVTLFIHETLSGIKYDRKLGRWYEDDALDLINDYPSREGWTFRVERHPGGNWHLYPIGKEDANNV